jgi:LPXTG-motif cell wall-anchored protein
MSREHDPMTPKIRILTGSLATLAVASAVTLASPSAYAADQASRGCGQPAVPAVYTSVSHDPVLRAVPAVTHDEWRWQRQVTSYEYEFARIVSAAYTESDWTRDVAGTTEYQWSHKVVDRDAVPGSPEQGHFETVVVTPAVTVTQFEYIQQQNGMTRWERDGWNGEHAGVDDGRGWLKTGNTREEVVTPAVTDQQWVVDQAATPAVDEVSHLEYTWATASPGADWAGPLDSRTVGGGTESATTTGDDVPAGSGWTLTETHVVAAVVDTVWAPDAPAGYDPTGAARVSDVSTEETDATSAVAPDGYGWTQVDGSHVVVVDQPETFEIVGEGWTEQVLVSPEVPATAPCADAPPAGGSTVVSGVHGGSASAPVGGAAAVLPNTGNPVSPVLLTAGLGALLAGGVLVHVGRKRRTV